MYQVGRARALRTTALVLVSMLALLPTATGNNPVEDSLRRFKDHTMAVGELKRSPPSKASATHVATESDLKLHPARITVLVVPSPVDPEGRPQRLQAISETWGRALRNSTVGMQLRVLLSQPGTGLKRGGTTSSVQEEHLIREAAHFTPTEVLPRPPSEADNAGRLFGALRAVYNEGSDWIFAVNDHTFVVPENLRCFVDTSPLTSGGASTNLWFGHKLQENGPKGSAFVSGAAGYLLSRSLLGAVLKAMDTGACFGSRRERSQPGLMLAKCLRQMVDPIELADSTSHAPMLHVYGPVRLVSGQVDDWWSNYRKNAGAFKLTGSNCCAPDTISFHYCFGPEQRLLDGLLRFNRQTFTALDDEARVQWWPSTKELGMYSHGIQRLNPAARKELWSLLLERLQLATCGNTR